MKIRVEILFIATANVDLDDYREEDDEPGDEMAIERFKNYVEDDTLEFLAKDYSSVDVEVTPEKSK